MHERMRKKNACYSADVAFARALGIRASVVRRLGGVQRFIVMDIDALRFTLNEAKKDSKHGNLKNFS